MINFIILDILLCFRCNKKRTPGGAFPILLERGEAYFREANTSRYLSASTGRSTRELAEAVA